jgi:hypothetical protein
VTEKSDDAAVAKTNLVEHLKNIDAACDDTFSSMGIRWKSLLGVRDWQAAR